MTDYAARRTAMVDGHIRPSDVTKFPIIDALLDVPRERFVPAGQRDVAYMGDHVDLGGGRVVLDARILAKMLDTLNIQANELVLDIGAALGYSAAVIGRLAEAVVALEEDATMATEAEGALSDEGADNVAVIVGPLAEGAAKHGPYDVILLEGAVEQVPDSILDQLKEGGRIGAIFMEGALGRARFGIKSGGRVSWRFAFNATAPLLPGFAAERAFEL
ncbi:protein-L-isoaspartate O-methyltransferase [Maritimibacter sp. 55A14]|uniref:protein-L-isoaspartate O-methyltransferase family protein n=1 Tax=Maritimibacter sp. 55A14 TaxID=2174844 RepID=UPI000D60E20A|nr:protein-L-isoaspartate O-methyltransferase [Maritimibacter sp. 55A14]PWE32076.1 protein-L-isoaspartate O-methyltransferase [Maritimibacter sp. 55A14]